MKKIIFILFLLFISVNAFSQTVYTVGPIELTDSARIANFSNRQLQSTTVNTDTLNIGSKELLIKNGEILSDPFNARSYTNERLIRVYGDSIYLDSGNYFVKYVTSDVNLKFISSSNFDTNAKSFYLWLVYPNTTSHVLNWATTIMWQDNTEPTVSVGDIRVDIYAFIKVGMPLIGGGNQLIYYGNLNPNFLKNF